MYGKRWRKVRENILKRDKYRSKISERYGKLVQADTVHHILPYEYFPEYKYAAWNLISVTKIEHNRLHDRETHKLTAEGLELARRTIRKRNMNMVEIMARLGQ